LSFIIKKPVLITLRDGSATIFSRRDLKFWDWFFAFEDATIDFTDNGEVLLALDDCRVLLRPGTNDFYTFQEIFLLDIYSIRSLRNSFNNVIDIGANIGLFCSAMLKRAKRVIAVEPVSENYEQALKNINLNGGCSSDVLRYAITTESNQLVPVFREKRNTVGHSLIKGWVKNVDSRENVPAITLSDLLRITNCNSVDLLKCDVEGSEYDIFLRTSPDDLKKITMIIMEVHISGDLPPSLLRKLVSYLESVGFSIYSEKEISQLSSDRQSFILTAKYTG
jgi:FkbM family methyltransferase